jgi:hypothetical protein
MRDLIEQCVHACDGVFCLRHHEGHWYAETTNYVGRAEDPVKAVDTLLGLISQPIRVGDRVRWQQGGFAHEGMLLAAHEGQAWVGCGTHHVTLLLSKLGRAQS